MFGCLVEWYRDLELVSKHVKNHLHPRKPTCLLEMDYFNRKYIFQPLIFSKHVSFPGSIFGCWKIVSHLSSKLTVLDETSWKPRYLRRWNGEGLSFPIPFMYGIFSNLHLPLKINQKWRYICHTWISIGFVDVANLTNCHFVIVHNNYGFSIFFVCGSSMMRTNSSVVNDRFLWGTITSFLKLYVKLAS